MRTLSRLVALTAAICGAGSVAIGQTVVNSTFLDGDHFYSHPANWSPAEVPNNSADKIYNVTTPALSRLSLDTDATVTNLTVGGYNFLLNGGSYTVAGTASIGTNTQLNIGGTSTFTINGSLSNFDSTTKTLTGGIYRVGSSDAPGAATPIFRFPDADIVNNGAALYLYGASAITDNAGRDALRNFTHNLPIGSLTVGGRDYTINNPVTNEGPLVVFGGQSAAGRLILAGGLRNYDPQTKRLSGGIYQISVFPVELTGTALNAQLIVAGADIVHNSGSITLEIGAANGLYPIGPSPTFTDENGNNALRNFSDNEAFGVFQLNAVTFQAASDFMNAGTVVINLSSLQIPSAHVYRQVGGGTTVLGGGRINGDVEILGGRFALFENQTGPHGVSIVGSSVSGNITITNALLEPNPSAVTGSVRLSDGSRSLFRPTLTRKQLTAQSTVSLAGILEIAPFGSSSSEIINLVHASAISGVFSNAPNGSRVSTMDGKGSYVVTYSGTDVTLSDYLPTQPIARLLNISTRAQVLTGNDVAIGGFIIPGSDPKNVVIRALGPSLAKAGVMGPLQDSMIELHDSKGAIIATNDNWRDNSQGIEVSAAGLAPTDAAESAIFAVLSPGTYTAIVRGKNNSTGVALVEVYDLSSNSQSRLANISTRGFIDSQHVLIGGLIAGGNAQDTVHVVVRAIGRGLQDTGIQDFLADPALEVRDKNGALVAANDDFTTPSTNPATVPKELWPSNSADAATGITIPPGNYTVVVSGKAGQSGNALVEIYDLNN